MKLCCGRSVPVARLDVHLAPLCLPHAHQEGVTGFNGKGAEQGEVSEQKQAEGTCWLPWTGSRRAFWDMANLWGDRVAGNLEGPAYLTEMRDIGSGVDGTNV